MRCSYYVGIDVGTKSARAVLTPYPQNGKPLLTAVEPLIINQPLPQHFEQASEQIWTAVCTATQKLLSESRVNPDCVKGIGFDATCSLVCLNRRCEPVSISTSTTKNNIIWNIIMWMDHRASDQAERISSSKHRLLDFVGGNISLEMQPPKLLWLKEHLPEQFAHVAHFMDLSDYLTMKASGQFITSQCSAVCKWLYTCSPGQQCWADDFWNDIGLPELSKNDYARIGKDVRPPGSRLGYLSANAAKELGLHTNVAVAVGIIDAHAGTLTTLFARNNSHNSTEISERLAMICGTSTCHMSLSRDPQFVVGVWGPYFEAILPEFWLNEAGQSAVGPMLDMVVDKYSDSLPEYCQLSTAEKHAKVATALSKLTLDEATKLGRFHHVWPDYHGNRSPLANSELTATVMGLQLPDNIEPLTNLLAIYVAHIQSTALMTRFIVETLERNAAAKKFRAIHLCGGLQNNACYVQAHADACQLPIVIPNAAEPVALGAAILGACASGDFPALESAAKALAPDAKQVIPSKDKQAYYDWKYKIFRKLGDLQLEAAQTCPL